MPSFKSFVSALAFLAPLASAQIGGQCPPLDVQHANPIATQYTQQNTGTLNGSIAVIPITLASARAIIPSQYPILTKQIAQWLPSLGANKYPLLVSIEKLHDIYRLGKSAGSSADYLRAHVTFPFVDRLKDGYTAMAYTDSIIVSNAATGPQASLESQGYNVSGGYFASCNAYEYENGTANLRLNPNARSIDNAAWVQSNTNLGLPNIAYRFKPVSSSPYSIDYFYNVTNQPLFSGGSTCQSFVRLYNTDVSTPPYSPVRVYGNVTALRGFFGTAAQTIWNNVYGMKLDVAYHVGNSVACSSLKGFHVNSAPA